ncbi:MAG: DNA translocase FtsK [Chloroflexota bacterium]
MAAHTDRIIADALRRYIEGQLRARPAPRAFFRLSDFSAGTYEALLDDLRGRGWRLAGKQLDVYSIEPVAGHPETTMDPERSPTWYRNTVAEDHALVLIQNRRTSDAQSLQDLYPVTALALSTSGLTELIDACFTSYQLAPAEQRRLCGFVNRLSRVVYQPQLRDLAEFLAAVDRALGEQPGTSLDEAIAGALPYLGLFRCRDLAAQMNSARGDKLLRQLRDAARIGSEVLDERTRETYLSRLQGAGLDDDEALGGLSTARKRELLERFIDGQLRDDRGALLQVLQIDWREIQQVISAKSRITRAEKLNRIADQLVGALGEDGADDEDLQEIVADLRRGDDPDAAAVDRALAVHSDGLPPRLRNELRRLVKTRTRKHADFLAGLAALAVELIYPLRSELSQRARLRVSPNLGAASNAKHLPAALEVFRALYGGIDRAMPAVSWELEKVWTFDTGRTDEQPEEDEDAERERMIRVEVPFRVVVEAEGEELAQGELVWQYRSDSPASATAQTLAAERALLDAAGGSQGAGDTVRLRVPIYNSCPVSHEIGDLDIHHPLQSLGAWFERPGDLRAALEAYAPSRLRPPTHAALSAALDTLERAWASLVAVAVERGLFAADIDGLITAYEGLLRAATASLQTGQEVQHGYRVINQAWMIGTPSFESWAVMPLLHPLKLLWWRERARFFNDLIARLLDPAAPATIVDQHRYLRELDSTYGSSQFPPLLALPPGEGRPAECYLPAEEVEGYELYFRESVSAEAFGLDTDLLAQDENEVAAQRAVEGIAAVVQDYIETYPFVRDGLEIVLFECRNGALPGLLVERLTHIGARRNWKVRLSVIVHTTARGAPLFRRVSEWVQSERVQVVRQGGEYFPPISLKVIECSYEELLKTREDTDIVILADVLADRGQRITASLPTSAEGADETAVGYLPTYRAQQEPFQRGELHRQLLLTPPQQPAVARLFLLAQYAASERRAVRPDQAVRFYRELRLDEWEQVLGDLHDHYNWVICYDPTVDRFLMESTFPEKVQVIRYSLGLGAKRQHNLTVSSSHKAQDIVVRRLAARLAQMFHRATPEFLRDVAEQLVTHAKRVSGDIVLRAAGPGAFLNELIGLVVARFETERRLRAALPDALITWVLLDDFEHWFGAGKFPDLLCVAIGREPDGGLRLHAEVLEAKCVGQLSFEAESLDAQRQVRQGVERLARAFAAGGEHLDALYWYDQLYRAVIGNLEVEFDQQELWELFRARLYRGDFRFEIEGHSWAFCYDGQVGAGDGPEEHRFAGLSEDLADVPLVSHHYGRSELSQALRALVEAGNTQRYAPELWEPTPEELPSDEGTAETGAGASSEETPETPAESTNGHTELDQPPSELTPQVVGGESEPKDDGPEPAAAVTEPAITDHEREWLEAKARDLDRALRLRGVQAQRINAADADVGPSIVRFKLRLGPNESLKKLQAAAVDLARDLALVKTPFIDNVLGSNFVGVDIPRERAETVELRPLLEQLGTPGPAELPIILGKTPDGRLLVEDLAEFPHALVAGATGSGKSVFLRSVLLSLMTCHRPGQVELLIVDPKQTDFSFFDGLPYLWGGKVFTDPREARDALLELVRSEMPRRQQLMRGRSMRLKEFNQRFPAEALPPIVAMIDEYAQLLSIMSKKDSEQFERDLMSLAAVARATSIHLVLATQRPSVDVVTGTLKANLPARIAFQVPTNSDSRVVLDVPGAENLLGRGDMLFRRPSGETIRLQAPFMGEEEMQAYLAALAARGSGHP